MQGKGHVSRPWSGLAVCVTCGHDLDALRGLLAHQGALLRLRCLRLLLLVARGCSCGYSGSRSSCLSCTASCCRICRAILRDDCWD